MASMNLKRYFEAELKIEKTTVVHGLVNSMKEACPSGGFLKRTKDKKNIQWMSIAGRERLDKVGHCKYTRYLYTSAGCGCSATVDED